MGAIATAMEEGRAHGRAEAILIVLARRGFELRPEERARILAERDLDVLTRWLADAVTCARVANLFTAD